MNRALDGALVVALEQAVAAPLATCRLADAGARVIKVERPGGDFARHYDRAAGGESAYFAWLNRGKESLILDLKNENDRRLLANIVARADVFVQNLAPGSAARLGFDSGELRERHPRLVTCDISGYGEEGPYAKRRAYDLLVQAESGLASITGGPTEPGRVGVSVCDVATGMEAYAAILEALMERERSGRGNGLAVSLFASMAEWMTVPLLFHDYAHLDWPRVGLAHATVAPYGAYPLGDGSEVLIAVQQDDEFARFCAVVLQRAELAHDERFRNNEARTRHRRELDALITTAFSRLDRTSVVHALDEARVAYGFLNSVAELSHHPQLRRVSLETPSGTIEVPAPAVRWQGNERPPGRVPALGEHSEAIRREFAR